MNIAAALIVSTHAIPGAVLVFVAGWVAGLWLISRVDGARFSCSISRSFASGSSGRRVSARAEHRMLARPRRSRRASRRFRKALLFSALITAAVLPARLHPHAR